MSDLTELLQYIPPDRLDYQEWVDVGMALHEEGYSCSVWEDWSSKDGQRFNPGECEKKWKTFNCGGGVTGGTIYHLAQQFGYVPTTIKSSGRGSALGWNDTVSSDDYHIIDKEMVSEIPIYEPKNWNPKQEIIRYLETLFDSSDIVGYVTQVYRDTENGRISPTKGTYSKTCSQIIDELNKYDDISYAIGDVDEQAGAWIRFNPLDGKGCRNDNVTKFRYALVESDSLSIEKQNALLRKLELPIAALVYSGGKSIHAIVKIDALDYREYKKRVEYLYNICNKNGFEIDKQNKNPSRLSRLPGVIRNGKKQFLIDTNIGKDSWIDWEEYIETYNDDLPEIESLDKLLANKPPLAPELIEGVLRCGHKMLIAGPSKAGKSFALIKLCIAIAEGLDWFGWNCTQGKVLYVNLEIDNPSCIDRFHKVYKALGIEPKRPENIEMWNLRGKAVPMDKLAPSLIRRAKDRNCIAVIIDPIYKVLTGDENSADQMAKFCNQFDKVCNELGCAVIYCHHHSKGAQGGKKSMDRASGSGVFARDPDALIDLTELEIDEKIIKEEQKKASVRYLNDLFERYNMSNLVSVDASFDKEQLLDLAKTHMAPHYQQILDNVRKIEKDKELVTAWQIEGTLREFPRFAPIKCWYDYPIHRMDIGNVLAKSTPADAKAPWEKGAEKSKKKRESKKEMGISELSLFLETEWQTKEIITIQDVMESLGIPESTARNRLRAGGYKVKNAVVYQKNNDKKDK